MRWDIDGLIECVCDLPPKSVDKIPITGVRDHLVRVISDKFGDGRTVVDEINYDLATFIHDPEGAAEHWNLEYLLQISAMLNIDPRSIVIPADQ